MQKVESDKLRQGLREALTALKKGPSVGRVWITRPGDVTIKTSIDKAKASLMAGVCVFMPFLIEL